MSKYFFMLSAILLSSFKCPIRYVDPTGTYILVGKTKAIDGETYGYSGQIQVKKLTGNKIVMTFGTNKGAPSYNSGSFVDTLDYKDNKVIYTDPESDSTCKITFVFTAKGIDVKEEAADFNSGCGFGHAVVASGFYKKTSAKTPILVEYLTGKRIGQ